MWRIFSGIPRAIRQHWNGPRATSGIYKEEEPLCDCQLPVSCVEHRHAGNSFDTSQRGSDESGRDTDREHYDWWRRPRADFWSLFSGSHRALEAVTWGAAVVLGIKLSHVRVHGVTCGPNDIKPERRGRCLLYHIAFALPGGQTAKKVLGSDPPVQNDAKTTEVPEESDPVTKVMTEFKNICSKYTALGKNIMGLTKAKAGDMESAVEDLAESSDLGHAGAQYNMGLCFELGQGVNTSIAQAAKFYSKAATSDHPEALYNLAMLYLKGEGGVNQDTAKALSLLERAAHHGLIQAQTFLGVYYTEEEKEDMEKAVRFFHMAAEKDDSEAQYFLGICYEQGWGVEVNECKAASLYGAAAQNGHDGAMYNLGVFHEYGLGGLPEDRVSALDLFSQSASLGNESANFKLQEWYANAALLEWSAKFEGHPNSFVLDGPPVMKSPESGPAIMSGLSPSASLPSLATPVCGPETTLKRSPPLSPSVSSPILSDLVKHNIGQFSIGHQFLGGFTKSAAESFILEQFFARSERAEPKASFFLGDEYDDVREATVTEPPFDIQDGNFCTTGLYRTRTMPELLSVACP